MGVDAWPGVGMRLGAPSPWWCGHDDGDGDDHDDDDDHDDGDDDVDVDYVGIVPDWEWSSCDEVSLVPNSSLSPQSWLAFTFRNLDTIFIMVFTLLLSLLFKFGHQHIWCS